MNDDVAMRVADEDDVGGIAATFAAARRTSMPYLPALHTPAEDAVYFAGVLRDCEVWIAETPEQIVGFVAFSAQRVEHLYVHPEYQDIGIGTALLAVALEDDRPRDLWVFQQNRRAIAFYERHGFREVERTDGARNEERQPDARYRRDPSLSAASNAE